jgi:hypothetical protein
LFPALKKSSISRADAASRTRRGREIRGTGRSVIGERLPSEARSSWKVLRERREWPRGENYTRADASGA